MENFISIYIWIVTMQGAVFIVYYNTYKNITIESIEDMDIEEEYSILEKAEFALISKDMTYCKIPVLHFLSFTLWIVMLIPLLYCVKEFLKFSFTPYK